MAHTPVHPQPLHDVHPIDPLHDIDARKTVRWAVVSVIGFVVGWWLLTVVYDFVLEQEHHAKVSERETLELNALRDRERAELEKAGDAAEGRRRVPIDEAIRRLSEK